MTRPKRYLIFRPLYPSWVVRDPALLREARQQRFRSQRRVDEWVEQKAKERGKKAIPFAEPKNSRSLTYNVRQVLYNRDERGRKTPIARYLNLE